MLGVWNLLGIIGVILLEAVLRPFHGGAEFDLGADPDLQNSVHLFCACGALGLL